MSFSRPIQWYHCHADPFWPDGTFKFSQTMPFFLYTGWPLPSARLGGWCRLFPRLRKGSASSRSSSPSPSDSASGPPSGTEDTSDSEPEFVNV